MPGARCCQRTLYRGKVPPDCLKTCIVALHPIDTRTRVGKSLVLAGHSCGRMGAAHLKFLRSITALSEPQLKVDTRIDG
jgi:hypothetical protein